MFCLPHRVSLILAVEGLPVHWGSIKINKASGSCPFCRAMREGEQAFNKAVDKWTTAGRHDPSFLMSDAKVSPNNSDKDMTMDPTTQQNNRERLRQENNQKIVRQLKGASTPGNNKREPKNKPTKKPNHLRLV